MNNKVTWIDQTVNAALNQAVSWPQLALIIRYLAQMSIYTGDIWLNDWEKYLHSGSLEADGTLLAYLKSEWRIKIESGQGQAARAAESGFSHIILSVRYNHIEPLSAALDQELKALSSFHKKIYIELLAAGDYSEEELMRLGEMLQHYQIQGLIYSDDSSRLDAFSTFNKLVALQKTALVPLEFHGYNSYGLGVSNAEAALRAGVSRIAVSIGGVYNQVALEEIWMVSKYFLQLSTPPTYFADYCRRILICLEIEIPGNKAILGQEIFSHESGIHVDGVTKNPELYEAFSPEEVGLTRKLVIGKHSGSAALRYKMQEWKLGLNKRHSQFLLTAVRKMATAQKAAITDFQLKELYWQTLKL